MVTCSSVGTSQCVICCLGGQREGSLFAVYLLRADTAAGLMKTCLFAVEKLIKMQSTFVFTVVSSKIPLLRLV